MFQKSPAPASRAVSPWKRAFEGALCGVLAWLLVYDLGLLDLIPFLRGSTATVFLALFAGALFGLTRILMLLRVGAGLALGLWLLVAFSPLADALAKPLLLQETPQKADAIVVVQAGIQKDGDFGATTLQRTLGALELMQQGYAPRLIVTEVADLGSHREAATKLMRNLALKGEVLAVGPVSTTHDEAQLVGALLKSRGWSKILLVTSPTHSRRATLAFRRQGVQVISTPCRETTFDFENLPSNAGEDRIRAFGQALHEIIGLRTYRMRGWI